MSDLSQNPTLGCAMNATTRDTRSPSYPLSGSCAAGPASARLQTIHDLIRSGEYHVPATAIADRMIERMMADKQRDTH
jgi:anti-sigma28 factor (negative regulator of flagellin synthesis)